MSVRYISDNLYITTGYSSDKQFSLRIKNLSIDCIFCYNDNFYNLLSSMLLEFVKEEFYSETNEVVIKGLSDHSLRNHNNRLPKFSTTFVDRSGMTWAVIPDGEDLIFTLHYSGVVTMPNELTIIKG